MKFETITLPEKYDELAPDNSEIRLLLRGNGGSLVHCKLPPYEISLAVKHKTVEEIWYFIQGQGQVWRKLGNKEKTVDVNPGTCITIPPGTQFQFRNTSDESLCIIIVTMPPWPGDQEAIRVKCYWEINNG